MNSRATLRFLALGISATAMAAALGSVHAQALSAGSAANLPAVTVDAPRAKARPVTAQARPAAGRQTRVARSQPRRPAARIVRSSPAVVAPPAPATPPVDAQSPTGPGVGYAATRTATATKTDTPILETPQSVSVVTKDQIRDTGAQTLSDAISYSAGVQTQPFGYDSRYDLFLVRGFTTNTVGIYQDGLREATANFGRFRNEPSDLERIEILRGPSSVLYGGSNPGGIVNLVSKTPVAGSTFGTAAVEFGSYNDKQTRFDVNTPIAGSDIATLRINGFFRDSNTQVPATPNNRANISPSLLLKFGDATTLTILGNYQGNRNSGWPYYIHTTQNVVYNVRAGDPSLDALQQEQASIGYKLESHYGDLLTFHQTFRASRFGFSAGIVDQLSSLGQPGVITPTQTLVPRYGEQVYDQLGSVAIDNNVQAKFETGPIKHTVLVGVDYFAQHYTENTATSTLATIGDTLSLTNPLVFQQGYYSGKAPGFSSFASTYQKIDQVGVYGQEQATFGNLHINLGIRHDDATQRTNNLITGSTVASNDGALTGRAGALYLFDSGFAPYVNFSTSFLPTAGTTFSSTPFKPTSGQQIEGGVKYAPPGLNTTFTASYFDIHQNNVTTSDPSHPGFSIQTGQVHSQGVELEAVTTIAKGLNGIASFSNTNIVNSQDTLYQGKVPIGVPRNQAAFFLDYTIQSGMLAGFGGGGGVRYIGPTFASSDNTLRNNAIVVGDLQAHYDTGRFRFQVSVRNVADQRIAVCQNTNCEFSQGRFVLGSLTARF
jgi:iron complex outermembrane receptor protein